MAEVLYTNFVQIRAAFYDVTLTFCRVSEVVEGEGGPQPVVEELARVQMSPQHARALLRALDTTLRQYEEKFGAIPTAKADTDGGQEARG